MVQFSPLLLVILLSCIAALAVCDLPTHCLPEQMEGTWEFSLTADGKDRSTPRSKCPYRDPLPFKVVTKVKINVAIPNVATNVETGTKGTWTAISVRTIRVFPKIKTLTQ